MNDLYERLNDAIEREELTDEEAREIWEAESYEREKQEEAEGN